MIATNDFTKWRMNSNQISKQELICKVIIIESIKKKTKVKGRKLNGRSEWHLQKNKLYLLADFLLYLNHCLRHLTKYFLIVLFDKKTDFYRDLISYFYSLWTLMIDTLFYVKEGYQRVDSK